MKTQIEDGFLSMDDVAKLFRVDPRTVARWVKSRKLSSILMTNGHRRFDTDQISALLSESEYGPLS